MSEQTLFDAGPRLKAYDQTQWYSRITAGQGRWWATKCLDCDQWVSKFDESEEETLWLARNHRCPPTKSDGAADTGPAA